MPETTTEPTALADLAARWKRQSVEYLTDWQDYDSHDGQERRGQGIALGDAASELRAALAAAPAGPDDAHTETFVVRGRVTNVGDDTTSTLRHTEWLTIGTDEDGNEGAETFEAQLDAVAAATRWRIRGMTNVYVERHDVSTTRTVTLWEAQR